MIENEAKISELLARANALREQMNEQGKEKHLRNKLDAISKYLKLPKHFWDVGVATMQDKEAVLFATNLVVNQELIKQSAAVVSIYGSSSTGKTCLAVAILRNLVLSRSTGLFISADSLQGYVQSGAEFTEETVEYRALNDDFLVIDDIGTECISKGHKNHVVSILEERSRRGKCTVLTSEEEFTELSKSKYEDKSLNNSLRVLVSFMTKWKYPEIRKNELNAILFPKEEI